MTRVLVTGAAGFIGAKTCERLLRDGAEVVGVDNLNDYYDVRLKRHRLEALEAMPGFRFEELDIEDLERVDALLGEGGFEAVINLAARAGVRYSMENPHVYMTTNAHGTLNLLDAMRRNGIGKFVLASTSSLYAGLSMPFSEELPVNTPISPYAATKKAAESMAYAYHHLYGIDVSVLRYFTVYGPAGRPDMAPFRFVRWIAEGDPVVLFGDGSQARDFTYVDDIAAGTIAGLKPVGFEVINLGGGRNPITINRMTELIEAATGERARIERKPFHKADMKETWADIAKAERLLGWRPTVSFEEGIANTTRWYLDNRAWARSIAL